MIHVLLTRTPLYSPGCPGFLVRLACVRRAASVDSEPGSNSHLKLRSQVLPGANYLSFGNQSHPNPSFTWDKADRHAALIAPVLLRVLTSSSLLHPTRLSKICALGPDIVISEPRAGLETRRGPCSKKTSQQPLSLLELLKRTKQEGRIPLPSVARREFCYHSLQRTFATRPVSSGVQFPDPQFGDLLRIALTRRGVQAI